MPLDGRNFEIAGRATCDLFSLPAHVL